MGLIDYRSKDAGRTRSRAQKATECQALEAAECQALVGDECRALGERQENAAVARPFEHLNIR